MSTFVKIIKGAASSNTVQLNAILLAIWTAFINTDMIQTNPEFVQIIGGITAIANILLRFKTSKPISER